MRLTKKIVSVALALTAMVNVAQARTAFTVMDLVMEEVGSDVIVTYSGGVDLSGLTPSNDPGIATILSTSGTFAAVAGGTDFYSGTITGLAFGAAGPSINGTATGSSFGFFKSDGVLAVPSGYVTGGSISGSATFANTTLAGFGAQIGMFSYLVGGSTINLDIRAPIASAVPLPAGAGLMCAGLMGLGALGRRRAA